MSRNRKKIQDTEVLEYIPKIPPKEVIIQCACIASGIRRDQFDEITRRGGFRKKAMARQLAIIYYLSNTPRKYMPLTKVGREFGYKDHSSVLYLRGCFINFVEAKDPLLHEAISVFKQKIREQRNDYTLFMNPFKNW